MKILRDQGFRCTKCGLCCRSLGRNPIFREIGLDRGDGICKFLDLDTNLCTIYEDRPLICRVDDMYEETQLSEQMSKAEWQRLNEEVCKKLQEESTNNDNKES